MLFVITLQPKPKQIIKMKTRKDIHQTISLMMMALSMLFQISCRDQQSEAVEEMVFSHTDKAAEHLSAIDTTRLDAESRMIYNLNRILLLEEQWQMQQADTLPHTFVSDDGWKFKRESTYKKGVLDKTRDSLATSSSTLQTYHYFEEKSIGGVSDNRIDLRRFGRLCYSLGHYYTDNSTPIQADQLYLTAIHCAETAHDYETAFRAYHQFAGHLQHHHTAAHNEVYWTLSQALNAFFKYEENTREQLTTNDSKWLLTIMNDYGMAYLQQGSLNPEDFHVIVEAANLVAASSNKPLEGYLCDSIQHLLKTINPPHALPFSFPTFQSVQSQPYSTKTDSVVHYYELGIWKGGFEDASMIYEQKAKEGTALTREAAQRMFEEKMQNASNWFNNQTRNSLAAGYERKNAMLQSRLLIAVIIALILAFMLVVLLFLNWRNKIRRQQQAERLASEQEKKHLSSLIQQKEMLVASLRGHIIDKNEIIEMLKPTAGKHTVINASNWREIEATLDMADNRFVGRLRQEHPDFSEEDIRLCMLVRLKLSNSALSAIYNISVSAVQHRKQKLKKEGFGVTDPNVTLEQVIAQY